MQISSSKSRMGIVDSLRGFSLAGIVIVHMVENYAGGPVPEEAMAIANQGVLDLVINGFILLFLRGKFFALFSFLFGLSFFIMMDSADQRQEDFKGTFFWRLCLLLGIGYLHHLFYRGDILTVYALLGMFLIPFYRIRSSWILLVSGLLFLGIPRFLIFMCGGGEGIFIENAIDPNSAINTSYFNTIKSGSILDVFSSNAISGHIMKAEFQMGIFGRGYLTFGFFLLGLWFGRLKFFRKYLEFRKETRNALWIGLASLVIFIGLSGFFFVQLGPEPDFNTWWAMFGLTALDLANLAMTLIILAGFVLLYKSPKFERQLNRFAPYGRMALTNYVVQSIIGTLIFYGWGLGLLGTVRNTYAFLMALGIIIVQVLISTWWLRKHYYGPLEWIWRSLTHFHFYPMKRS